MTHYSRASICILFLSFTDCVTLKLLSFSSREGNGTPLQYSCLENPMDGGAWKAAVHRVAEGQTQLSNFTFTFYFHALEKGMATHFSVLTWRIPGMGEPGGLPSMGSHRVGHNWSDLAAAAAASLDLRVLRIKTGFTLKDSFYMCEPCKYMYITSNGAWDMKRILLNINATKSNTGLRQGRIWVWNLVCLQYKFSHLYIDSPRPTVVSQTELCNAHIFPRLQAI